MCIDNTSLKILKYIKDNSPASFEAIAVYISDKALAETCIASLKTKNLIEGLNTNVCYTPNGVKCVTSSPYKITADGLAYLESIKAEKTNKKHKFIHDLIIAFIGAFLSNADRLCTFIIELIRNLLAL